MPTICVIERRPKVKQAFDLLEKYKDLRLDISRLNDSEYSMKIKDENYERVCEFVKELYSADLVPSE